MTSGARQGPRLFLIAGEPSGDRLGAALIRGLRAEAPADAPPTFLGVGGPAMAAEGFESLFPIDDLAVMGFAEVAARLPRLLRRISETVDAAVSARPDALITIDAPAFGLRVAERVKKRLGDGSVRFIHYVAPSVWAWRPKRAEKMAAHVDHLLALLPFEPPYFERVGLSCDFVGHPVIEATSDIDPDDRSFREEIGVAPDAPLLLVALGSRRGEVTRQAPVFRETVARLAAERPDLRIVSPTAENVAELTREALAEWPGDPVALDPRGRPFAEAERRKFRAMAAADAALAASGTVSLELAAMRAPMAIGYRVHPISAAIARRLIKIDTATLVNLVSETRTVPEFFQEKMTPDALAAAVAPLLTPGSPERAAQLEAADIALARLGRGDAPPSHRAARSVLAALARA